MKTFIRSYWKELHAMGKTAHGFLLTGVILFLFFILLALMLACLSFSGSSLPWEPWVGDGFSLLGRISVFFFGLSYIYDYLTRQNNMGT